jgi:hypothetical protein
MSEPREQRLERIVSVMRMVQGDCQQEAMELDGKPFSGLVVATQLGNILAEVSAVAKAVEALAEMMQEDS